MDAPSVTGFHRLRIAETRSETAGAVSLAFDVPPSLRDVFAFIPGQYLTLRARLGGEEVRRCYSICSGPGETLRIGIKRVPGGVFSSHVSGLGAGDAVEVMPPLGTFGVGLGEGRVYLGLAAGSGITPVLSILHHALARQHGSRFILIYGNRSTSDIMFRGALEDLKDRYLDRLSVVHVLSREDQDIAVLNGRLDGTKLRALLPGLAVPEAIDHAFLCGPGDMSDTLSETLCAIGLARERAHVERFAVDGVAPPRRLAEPGAVLPGIATATIIHDGKTNEISIATGEAVLDAALRAGLDLPWSCRGGMCSTCRARLREGEVTMTQNYALEEWETDSGYILTCQSHPVTKHVIVDYDHV